MNKELFAINIKKLRELLNLTQNEFGERLGKRYNTIQNWERGRAIPDATTFRHICNIFHVNSSWLRTGEGEMFLENTLPEHAANEAERPKTDSRDALIIAALRMATDEQKDFILKYIKEQNELASFREKARKNKKLG